MDSNYDQQQGSSGGGVFGAVERGIGDVEGKFRGMEEKHEEHEAEKYEGREAKDAYKEQQDYSQGRQY
ncbi:unnamed protein product [Didymodactylos carnosus]|uniref:Uncharacterized protein n=1 Tax=Didymodactylos carnosus TaxID=1234261 RepID=A0A814KR84_9BILA|nr:unnamed protein product [Didymodactylos carnosus]CAF1054267.1 unnamed protein product [Didymodactylos carnosus]CAF3806410.1 unnamed protein product [Didymodactylos carnosus]CAF3823465.1 unnamed protein product [Didymodactylos carnosus]